MFENGFLEDGRYRTCSSLGVSQFPGWQSGNGQETNIPSSKSRLVYREGHLIDAPERFLWRLLLSGPLESRTSGSPEVPGEALTCWAGNGQETSIPIPNRQLALRECHLIDAPERCAWGWLFSRALEKLEVWVSEMSNL
jgi:hypothetical protein